MLSDSVDKAFWRLITGDVITIVKNEMKFYLMKWNERKRERSEWERKKVDTNEQRTQLWEYDGFSHGSLWSIIQ